MNCPWCPFEGNPRPLHAHFSEAHGDRVVFEERDGRTFYGIDCPHCGDGYSHEIKPRGRDPAFVEEFRAQISLVAFDMLVNHLLVEHDPAAASAEDGPEEATADDLDGPAPSGLPTGPAWLTEARQKAQRSRPETGT